MQNTTGQLCTYYWCRNILLASHFSVGQHFFYLDNSQGQDSKGTEIWLRRKYQKKALQETIAIEGLIWDCCIIESPLWSQFILLSFFPVSIALDCCITSAEASHSLFIRPTICTLQRITWEGNPELFCVHISQYHICHCNDGSGFKLFLQHIHHVFGNFPNYLESFQTIGLV